KIRCLLGDEPANQVGRLGRIGQLVPAQAAYLVDPRPADELLHAGVDDARLQSVHAHPERPRLERDGPGQHRHTRLARAVGALRSAASSVMSQLIRWAGSDGSASWSRRRRLTSLIPDRRMSSCMRVSTTPGCSPYTRTPSGPASSAMDRVSIATPALPAQ